MRLPGYDYSAPGAYFVTVCTFRHICLFGDIREGAMRLNPAGEVAEACWREIPSHFTCVELDAFVVMPNHVHGIINIIRATHASRLPAYLDAASALPVARGPVRQSIGAIVGSFKAAVTRRLGGRSSRAHADVWQRNYFDHVIRTDEALNRIRDYILDNPRRWAKDRYNPFA